MHGEWRHRCSFSSLIDTLIPVRTSSQLIYFFSSTAYVWSVVYTLSALFSLQAQMTQKWEASHMNSSEGESVQFIAPTILEGPVEVNKSELSLTVLVCCILRAFRVCCMSNKPTANLKTVALYYISHISTNEALQKLFTKFQVEHVIFGVGLFQSFLLFASCLAQLVHFKWMCNTMMT